MSEVFKLSAPWFDYYRKIEALFGEDPDVLVQYDEEENIINIKVDGQDKADAITQLLPEEKQFGSITVRINVIPSNKIPSKIDLFKKAFDGNPIFSYAVVVDTGMTSNTFNYVIFRHKICQYWNDRLSDINGMTSILYEDLARDIFGDIDGIFFNTDLPENPGKPNNM